MKKRILNSQKCGKNNLIQKTFSRENKYLTYILKSEVERWQNIYCYSLWSQS